MIFEEVKPAKTPALEEMFGVWKVTGVTKQPEGKSRGEITLVNGENETVTARHTGKHESEMTEVLRLLNQDKVLAVQVTEKTVKFGATNA